MSTTLKLIPLKICLLGFDRRNLNALKLFFGRIDTGYCQLSLPDEADLVIVDIDRYGVDDEWQALRQNHPNVRGILFTVNKQDDSELTTYLQKPVKIPALLSKLTRIRESLSEDSVELMPGYPWSSDHLDKPEEKVEKTPETHQDTKHEEDQESVDQSISDVAYLAELGTLLDGIKRAVKRANTKGLGVRMHMANQGSIFIDPSEHWVFTDFSDATLRELCTERFNEAELLLSEFEDGESAKYVEGWAQCRETPIDVDSFMWDLALWTYNGLLPTGTRLDYKVELKTWPDLQRMTLIPFSMRIAALWTACPVSLIETVEVLNVPPEHVFKFYACCHTLGLLNQIDPSTDGARLKSIEPNEERRRFYLNILKHIKGKDFE